MTKRGNSDLVDIDVQKHMQTNRALLVSLDGDREKAVWLPLSEIEVERKSGLVIKVTLPEWLAVDKGLV